MDCQLCKKEIKLEDTTTSGICNVCGRICCSDCFTKTDVDDVEVFICTSCEDKIRNFSDDDIDEDAFNQLGEHFEEIDSHSFVETVEEIECVIESIQSDLDALNASIKELKIPSVASDGVLNKMTLELENILCTIKAAPEYILACQQAEAQKHARDEANRQLDEFYQQY